LIIAYVFWLLLSVFILFEIYFFNTFELPPLCWNIIDNIKLSPSKRYKTITYRRDCWATTHIEDTTVSLIDANADEKKEDVLKDWIIFRVFKRDVPEAEVIWSDDSHILIHYDDSAEFWFKAVKSGWIDISYH